MELLVVILFCLCLVLTLCVIKTLHYRSSQQIVQKTSDSDVKRKKGKKKKQKGGKGSTQVQVGKIIVNDKELSDLDLPDFPEFPDISGNFDNFSKDLDDYMKKVQKYSDIVYKAYKEKKCQQKN